MSEEKFTVEIVKQLPIKEIYNDVAHPALSTLGGGLQDATKLALAPISALVWGYDKISDYLDTAIPEYFARKKVDEDKIVTPDPAIAVPIVEAMRYTSHKEELKEMFTNLLGASMTQGMIDEHPGFVEVIKQLSPDECRMLKYLNTKLMLPMLKLRVKVDKEGGEQDIMPYFSDICYNANCDYPKKFPEYLDNLVRLGLVDVERERYFTNHDLYLMLREHPGFPSFSFDDDMLKEAKALFNISEYGKKFCYICLQ